MEGGKLDGRANPESMIELPADSNSTWPAVRSEGTVWTPDPTIPFSNRERQNQTGPYQRAIPAFIANAALEISSNLAAEIEEASKEIVRFDVEIGVALESYGAVLLRTEAVASSRIEKLTASARAIATAETDIDPESRNATMIVANTRTMQAAIAKSDTLDEQMILDMHAILMAAEPDIAGKWRNVQNWIGRGNAGPREASYVPPHSDRIPDLMKDLALMMRRTDLPTIALAGAAHAQFETIHPFVDGNGRTGRALIHAILRNKGMTTALTVPVSASLLTDTGAYFDALTLYRTGDLEPIISMMASASLRAVTNGRGLVANLHSIRQSWEERLRARRGADAWRLADLLIRQPVVTRDLITKELGVAVNNVNRVLLPFENAEILISSGSSNRGRRVWRSPEVLGELDDFARRVGRRTA
jgi:Fic family protein